MSNPVDIPTGTSQRSLLMLGDIPDVCFTLWLILEGFGGSEKLQAAFRDFDQFKGKSITKNRNTSFFEKSLGFVFVIGFPLN